MTTYDEWRVTGTWQGAPYEFTWSPKRGHRYRGFADPEAEARQFVATTSELDWTDGPHLHKRTVTVTDWQEIEP